jgi:hypothetical protein
VAAVSFVLASTAREARAVPLPVRPLSCSVCSFQTMLPDSLFALGMLDIAVGAGGLITGTNSTAALASGIQSLGWYVSSYVFGGLNLIATGLWASLLPPPGNLALSGSFTIAHASIAVFDIVAPTIHFARSCGPRVAPVAVGGRDAGGMLWSGVGFQLTGF